MKNANDDFSMYVNSCGARLSRATLVLFERDLRLDVVFRSLAFCFGIPSSRRNTDDKSSSRSLRFFDKYAISASSRAMSCFESGVDGFGMLAFRISVRCGWTICESGCPCPTRLRNRNYTDLGATATICSDSMSRQSQFMTLGTLVAPLGELHSGRGLGDSVAESHSYLVSGRLSMPAGPIQSFELSSPNPSNGASSTRKLPTSDVNEVGKAVQISCPS